MSTYRKRAATAAGSDAQGEVLDLKPCSRCGALTEHDTLAALGARCVPCFRRYCSEPQPKVDVGDKRVDPRGWAYALKRREEGGERLTPPQRAMWRAALNGIGCGLEVEA